MFNMFRQFRKRCKKKEPLIKKILTYARKIVKRYPNYQTDKKINEAVNLGKFDVPLIFSVLTNKYLRL